MVVTTVNWVAALFVRVALKKSIVAFQSILCGLLASIIAAHDLVAANVIGASKCSVKGLLGGPLGARLANLWHAVAKDWLAAFHV